MTVRHWIARTGIALMATPLATSVALAQADAVHELGKPNAVLSEPFSLVRSARELPDGRLIVTDWTEERLVVVDFARNAVTERGGIGAGPSEFRLPSALFPFRGDSTLMVDLGNARLAVLDGEGRIARSFAPPHPAAGYPSGVDAAGRIYFSIPQWRAANPLPGDTIEVAVVDVGGGTPRVITRIHGDTWAPPPTGRQDGPRIPIVIFARQDALAVAPSGRIAVVRGGDYSVEWIEGGRTVAKGPRGETRDIPATSGEKTAYVRQFLQSSPTSGRGVDGGLGHTPASELSSENVAAIVRRSTFAETLPFFRPGDVRLDASGRVWVGRWVRAGERRIYDIFDGTGRKVETVRLAEGRHLLALGKRHAYVIHTDDDDLQTLERYALPM